MKQATTMVQVLLMGFLLDKVLGKEQTAMRAGRVLSTLTVQTKRQRTQRPRRQICLVAQGIGLAVSPRDVASR